MNEKISAMMDGELDERAANQLIDALDRDSETWKTWQAYHLISDAMRGTRLLDEGFAARVAWRLAEEPTVLAPGQVPPQPRRWFVLPVAAAAVAVALVGWMALAPQRDLPVQAPALAAAKPPVMVPVPTAANDYLLAHQGFSPRVSFQGMVPYVRTVSDQGQESRK